MSPMPETATEETEQAPARRHSVHTRPIDAPEDREVFQVWEEKALRGSRDWVVVYSETLMPDRKPKPPPWVVWGIRYKGWRTTRRPLDQAPLKAYNYPGEDEDE